MRCDTPAGAWKKVGSLNRWGVGLEVWHNPPTQPPIMASSFVFKTFVCFVSFRGSKFTELESGVNLQPLSPSVFMSVHPWL